MQGTRAPGHAKCSGNFRGDHPSSSEVEKTSITPRESTGLKGWVPYSCICSRAGTKEMPGQINEWSSYLGWPRNEGSPQMSLNSCPPHLLCSNAKYVFISEKKGREKERRKVGLGGEGGRGRGKGYPSSLLLFDAEMGVLSGQLEENCCKKQFCSPINKTRRYSRAWIISKKSSNTLMPSLGDLAVPTMCFRSICLPSDSPSLGTWHPHTQSVTRLLQTLPQPYWHYFHSSKL